MEKPLAEFNARARARDGLRFSCRKCDLELKNDYRERQRAERKANPKPRAKPQRKVEDTGSDTGSDNLSDNLTEGRPNLRLVEGPVAPAPRIREVALTGEEDAERELAREYADILNEKLTVRQRANLMVKIAKMAKGPTAALALQALRDINQATGITSKSGQALEQGRLFLLPEGTQMRLKGAS